MKRFLAVFLIGVWALFGVAFADPPFTSWTAKVVPADARAGESAQILMTATVKPGWHIYQLGQKGGPTPTSFTLPAGAAVEANGKPGQPTPKRIQDTNFGIETGLFEGTVTFTLPVKIKAGLKGLQKIAVAAGSQACNDRTCSPPATAQVAVQFSIADGPARSDHLAPLLAGVGAAAQPAETPDSSEFAGRLKTAKAAGMLAFLWFAFSMGLLALLTPCVFPMIPITVSFFAKQQAEAGKMKLQGPLAYCVGIIGTFAALGLIVTALFGASGIQKLATNPVLNIALAVLFLALAANLFGLFEIQMPSAVVNKFGMKARGGGAVAALLMGLTFTLTSFTCTVPFVGTVLVGAAQGEVLYPVLGMLAFSTAFALPFFLLALFPQYLAKLPKSGSWLATVKAFMGFMEIAAALKFLSNADLVWQYGVLTRPVFLAIWTGVAAIGGFYLLGWLLLGHDPTKPTVGWPRRIVGLATLGAAVYCLAGIRGGSLGELSAFLPPDPYPGQHNSMVAGAIPWVETITEGTTRAKTAGRPMIVNFTGVTCTNCRWMEQNMFPRPEVQKEIGDLVPVELYTDRGTPADEANKLLEQKLAGVVTLPVYVVLSPDGKALKVFEGSTRDPGEFVEFLKAGKQAFTRLAQR